MKREERILLEYKKIYNFINDDNFKKIVKMYNGKTNIDNFFMYISYLNEFVNVWDYRNGKERFSISDNALINPDLKKLFYKLGFIKDNVKNIKYDYIIPLGGGKLTNHVRVLYSKDIIDDNNLNNASVVCLSTLRKLSDRELYYKEKYSSKALTEYDMMCSAVEDIFDVHHYREEIFKGTTEYNNSIIRRYRERKVYVLSAPSSDPLKRANTRGTFKYFINVFDNLDNKNVLLVTNQIYALYQYYSLIDLAIECNINLDIIGSENAIDDMHLYLQELKATINVMYKFVIKYRDIIDLNYGIEVNS